MNKRPLLFLSLVYFLACGNVYAADSMEDDLSGFDLQEELESEVSDELAGFDKADTTNINKASQSDTKNEKFNITGDISLKTSLGYREHQVDGVEYSGINQAQTSLYLQLDGKLSNNWKVRTSGNIYYDTIYEIKTENNYKDAVLDAYQKQIRLDDAYVQGRLTKEIDLKAGRQIVVWGKSDSIRITDVINPLDNRLPGMTDIEDLRLSVGMAKFDYYLGMWNLSVMIIPENRIMLEAPARSEFFPVDTIFSGTVPDPFLELQTPENTIENMQYAFAAEGIFSGWDLSFYAAHVLDQKWHFDNIPSQTLPLSSIKRVVSAIDMLGYACNIVEGNWLFKSEAAFLSGVKYNTTDNEKNRLDVLLGFDYMGIKDSVISLEMANRHIFDYESQMANQADFLDQDEVQTVLRATRSFSHDTINATALLSMFGTSWQNGGFTRVWMEYAMMDAVSLNIGVVDYIGGDKPLLEANKNNDRVFADISYSF